MVERSPFPYQGPLAPEQVSGRDALVRDLGERLTARRLTALLGPRRYGKTSVLKRVTTDLAATTGAETIWIDLYGLSSMADLAGSIDRGLSGVGGAVRRILDSVAGSLSVNLGVVGVELSKGKRDRPDPVLLLRSLLQVLVRSAQRHDLIVVFDEFAGIANVDQAAAVLRTELQHHYRDLAIVFAGSQPSTMRMLFTDEAQPFFAQADLVEIWPLAKAAVADIVERGFDATGRGTGGTTSALVAMAEGHPQRAMQLADALWWRTPEGGTASDETWEEALADVRRNVDNGSDRLFTLLPVGHQKTLRVIASGGSVHGTAADVFELASGTATAAVDALIGNGYVVRRDDDGRLRIVDPMLADWIRRRFPV
jgi:hypothetical protein